MTPDEVVKYVEGVRADKPARPARTEARFLMFDHIEKCQACQAAVRAENLLQDWLDNEGK